MPELVYPPNTVDVATENLKIAPQSIEAEQSVIGGLMLDKNAWDKIGDFTDADHPKSVQDTFEPVFGNLGIKI